MNKILERKKELKEGEKIPLCYDECFKIMFANPNRLEPLTLLLSKILDIEYEELEGKIELYPLTLPNETIGEKKMERDVVVRFREAIDGKIILEVNFRDSFYETIVNRNINYLSEVASKGLQVSDSYDKIEPTLLVNFNTFYVDRIHKKIFDYYYWQNEEGHILTEKQKILNINIAECYKNCYNKTYKVPNDEIERDIFYLSAAMYTDKIEEFNECIEKIGTKRNIKKIIEEVSSRMNENEVLKMRYVDFLEENKKINRSIIADEKKKARKEGLAEGRALKEKEMIINFYNNGADLELISKSSGLTVDEIKKLLIFNKKKR